MQPVRAFRPVAVVALLAAVATALLSAPEPTRGADTEERGQQQHRIVAGSERDDCRAGCEAGDDPGQKMVEVNTANRAAPQAMRAAKAGIRAHRREGEQEREQEKEKRLAAGPVDVVLVAGDEVEEVGHLLTNLRSSQAR